MDIGLTVLSHTPFKTQACLHESAEWRVQCTNLYIGKADCSRQEQDLFRKMGLQCGSIRMSRLVQTFTILVLCLHLGAAYGSKSLVGTRAGGSNEGPSTLAEKEKDFLEWVQRVGDRQSLSATATPSTTSSEASESSWVQANELGGGSVITVSKSGGAQFTTIQAAVDFVPKKNSQRVVIQIAAGVYQEKVLVPKSKPYITFQGAGSGVTTITYGDTKADTGKTQDSATVGVNSDGFIAKGITFKNSAPAPPPGAVGRQAVAFKIAGDKAAFYECSFLGAQDTLYDDHGRHYFENCYIQGSIDFIFGDGQSLYQGCELHALSVNPGSLTAQKRSSPGESTGFSFVRCTVSGSGMLYLGRAWGPYSRVVFSYTYIADIIIPQGWFNWGVPDREKTVFYGQYKCSGPGANENGRVAWAHELTDAQAAPFQSVSFIDGASWLQS